MERELAESGWVSKTKYNILSGQTIQATIGVTMSHAIFLSGNMDNDSNCKAGITSFPHERTTGDQTAQGMYEITLRDEFANMNELTGTITMSPGIKARESDMSLVDGLKGTVVWENDPMACPQMIVQLHKGLMKVSTNQTKLLEGSTTVVEHKDKD
jgi:hypothetical protein